MGYTELLKQCSLCSGLSAEEFQDLTAFVTFRKTAKDEILFLEGDPAAGFYVLLSGKVRVYKASPEGREYTLHRIGPGQIFAEAAIFRGDHFPANCIALVDSDVAFFPRDKFIQVIKDHPQISLKMIGSLSAFLREFNQTIELLSLKEISARLATFLRDLSQRTSKPTISLEMTKSELANHLATVSETLSRNLRKLIDLKVIRVEGKKITILDPSRLDFIAEGEKI